MRTDAHKNHGDQSAQGARKKEIKQSRLDPYSFLRVRPSNAYYSGVARSPPCDKRLRAELRFCNAEPTNR